MKTADKNEKKRNASYHLGIRKDKDGVMLTTYSPQANTVQVAGDFNNWSPEKTPMRKYRKEGVWKVKIPLTKGTYRYRYVVDGNWQHDPHNDQAEPNPYNGLNSVIRV